MKLSTVKRLRTEDFEQDNYLLISKLSEILNPFFEQIVSGLNKNIDFDNLNQELLNVTVKVDATGKPTTTTQYKTSLKTRVKGLTCIRAYNDKSYPTTAPFVSFTQSNDLLTIQHVTGLPSNTEFILTLIVTG